MQMQYITLQYNTMHYNTLYYIIIYHIKNNEHYNIRFLPAGVDLSKTIVWATPNCGGNVVIINW